MPKKIPKTETWESNAYLDALFKDFAEQVARYKHFTGHLMEIEARLDLAEKTLTLTRDHLELAIKTSEGCESRIKRFQMEAEKVQFVGMRLADACTIVLREHKKMTPQKLLDAINEGTFRFRTNAPLRELHAALLKHPNVKRDGNHYVWIGAPEEQLQMRLPKRTAKAEIIEGELAEVKPN